MTPPGQANGIVAVVEHEAFARLYRDELAQEMPAHRIHVYKVPTTTVSIFPDTGEKDVNALEIAIPPSHRRQPDPPGSRSNFRG